MKANFLKSIMPATAIVFAIAAAFATEIKGNSNVALVDAYILNDQDQCENTGIKCETIPNPVECTYNIDTPAFGLNSPPSETSCSVDLYMPQQQ